MLALADQLSLVTYLPRRSLWHAEARQRRLAKVGHRFNAGG
jgi:hypothetical protein